MLFVCITIANCDINIASGPTGWTPLHKASNVGNEQAVQLLIAHPSCQINACDSRGRTPLFLACAGNNENVVQLLANHRSCLLNIPDNDGSTPLHVATRRSYSNFSVDALLMSRNSQSLDLNASEEASGDTALHIVCSTGHEGVAKMLLKSGRIDHTIRNKGHSTPLHVACVNNQPDMVGVMVSYFPTCVNTPHLEGNNALHIAAQHGYTECARALMNCGQIKPNAHNDEGLTALYLACENRHIDTVDMLLRHHNSVVDVKRKDGHIRTTPIHWATHQGELNTIQLFAKHYPEALTTFDPLRRSLLHIAVWRGHTDIVGMLLSRDLCHVNNIDHNGATALHCAAFYGRAEILKMILAKSNASLNTTDRHGRTCLHIACSRKHVGIIELLVADERCNVNVKNVDGQSALHEACRSGHIDVVWALSGVDGIDVEACDSEGRTAMQMAPAARREEIARIFEFQQASVKGRTSADGRVCFFSDVNIFTPICSIPTSE